MNFKAVILAGMAGYAAFKVYQGAGRNTSLLESVQVLISAMGAKIMGSQVSKMTLSENGLSALAGHEGLSLKKYKDADGYSIGYGHFILPHENFDAGITKTKAAELLRFDSEIASNAVRAYVNVPLSQNQFDALVSLVYNIGVGAFSKSTLLKKLNAGDYSAAAAQFDVWNKVGGAIFKPLVSRRADEKTQFLA